MNKKVILIIVGVALVLCIGCVAVIAIAAGLGIGLTQPAATAGDAFMTALKGGDYAKAYALCSPSLQRELKDAQGLEALIKRGTGQPTAWSFSSRNVTNDQGELSGSVTFTGNREGIVRLSLTQVGGEWKIIGFNLSEK